MRVRVGPVSLPWSHAQGTWFYEHEGEEFEVVAFHEGLNRLYEVDVRHLASTGRIEVGRAYVPEAFAEEVSEDTAVVLRWGGQ
jgi:hypothetical protein